MNSINLDFISDETTKNSVNDVLSSSLKYWDISIICKDSLFVCCLKYIARYQSDNPDIHQKLKEYTLNLLLNNKVKFNEIISSLNRLLSEKLVNKLKEVSSSREVNAFYVSWHIQKNDLLSFSLFYEIYFKNTSSIQRLVEEIKENDEKWEHFSGELKSVLKLEKERNSGDCPICYTNVVKKKLFCGHSICQTCISNIVDNCCPFCRKKIQTVDSFKIDKIRIMCDVWLQPEEIINFLPLYNNLKKPI